MVNKIMRQRSGEMSMEALVKIAFVLIIAIVVFAIVFLVLRPTLENLREQRDNQDDPARGAFDILSNLFGGCKDNEERCKGDFIQRCEEGDWVTDERCEKGCNKEGDDCN